VGHTLDPREKRSGRIRSNSGFILRPWRNDARAIAADAWLARSGHPERVVALVQ
jgi:hypothetical protein